VRGDYYDAGGALVEWMFVENGDEAELGGDGLANVLDTDSDWREWEVPAPPPDLYLDFHDRTEIAYESYVTLLVRDGARFHVGPLNPGEPDTDGDGYPDAQEVACGFDPLDARDYGDCTYPGNDDDSDGLYDIEEAVLGTGINNTDSDGDGLWDGDEIHPAWWSLDPHPNANGYASNPLDSNSDSDLWDDWEEVEPGTDGYITNPTYEDTDGDGLNDYSESAAPPNGILNDPTTPDMDGDELYDYDEDVNKNGIVNAGETDANNADTDGDVIPDGPEVIFGTDPLLTDTDGDLLPDGLECGYPAAGDMQSSTMTDPRLTDSDFDGWDDGVEDANQNGMVDVGETDAQDRDTDDDMLPDYYEGTGNDPTLPPATIWAVGWVDNSGFPTLPFEPDTDFDGLEDNLEFEQMTNPVALTDTDGDGLTDGDEYYTYMTDPTDTDTDQDGCQENDLGAPFIEDVNTDTDGDGVHNGMDVDSDNDWVWDGDSGEGCSALDDVDGDTIPDVLDNDTDNDLLSDVQEMGLDTWHQYADNDRDFDEDCVLDGAEYYHAIHQPHTGEPNFRASDPKDFDTDDDGLHDGIEHGMTAAIPVDPIYGGTNPDPGVYATDATLTSHVGHWDSDEDGLTDAEEDFAPFSDVTQIGVVETDPQDDDTDDEGLWDGFEVNDLGTDPLLCDTDIDLLNDGLEIGLLEAQGDDTAFPGNPCGSARYDTNINEYGAYATDPNAFDTDGDFLLDGEEDADQDGFRDGNSPYDMSSDWNAGAGPGETDPNEWDTDRGGEDDGTEVGAGTDPLLYTDGDWDIDIHPDDLDASADTLWLGVPAVGILPGSSDMKQIRVWHTDLANNPDAFDGPSVAANIDSIYMRATSVHWMGPLWGGPDYEVPEADDADWFHYENITFSPSVFSLANGASQDVDVTVNIPEGAMPGWYFGYVQVETRRAFVEQELPDDYIMLGIYVAPHKDLDICDDDGDPLGVGLASAPYQFPQPPAQTEMHLAGVPMYPGTIQGMFRYANPNTNPDGVWPWPGGTPDGINDFNGLPAYPWVYRTWDTNTLDVQGNVNMTYEIEAQYEFSSGPVDPTSAISFASPIRDYLNLAEVDSAYVTIDTSTLPAGVYEGTVRVYEDSQAPWNQYTGGEVFDTFTLKFWLTVADLDIDDDYASMSGNHMTIEVLPGAPQGEVQVIQELRLVNPNSMNNIDDWDGPSGEATEDFWLYRYWNYGGAVADLYDKIPTYDSPTEPDPDNPDAVSFEVFLGGDPDAESILVWLDGVFGDTLEIGEAKKLRLWVGSTPSFLPAGEYTTPARDGWPYGPGTVPLCTRGRATGVGFDHPDVDEMDPALGPGIVYDEDILAVEDLMDYFDLTVVVPVIPDVAFDAESWDVTGDPGDHLCQATIVNNLGNADIADVHFDATQLECDSDDAEVILPTQIDFEPASIDIPLGGFESVDICVDIPNGAYACTYEGFVSLLAAGEEEFDQLPMNVTVNRVPAMDVEETAYGVAGNLMVLTPGYIATDASKQFQLTNLGNCEIYGVDAVAEGFPDGIVITFDMDDMVEWTSEGQAFILATVTAEWTDPWPDRDIYEGTVRVTADDGLEDVFNLNVHIAAAMEIAEDDLDVHDNMMWLTPEAPEPERVMGEFKLINTGPTDLSGITALAIEGLPDGVTADVTIDSECDWASYVVGTVTVDWSDTEVAYGNYETDVYVTANGGLVDNFGLTVEITELPAAAFVEDDVSVVGVLGDPASVVFTVVNTGNIVLEEGRVTFGVGDLVGATGSMIPSGNIEIVPGEAEIPFPAGEVEFTLVIDVPDGLLGQDYTGDIELFVDGEDTDELLGVTVTIERGEGYVNIYPNPYRGEEHAGMGITFALGEGAENAKITIYDMFGNLVTTLNGEEESRNGTEDAVWEDPLENDDGKQVASGMYIVTIDDGDDVETRKIMVIR
jgi:hypothetical protein